MLKFRFRPLLLAAMLFAVALPVTAGDWQAMPVNIFGDGDPANGVEDSREQIGGDQHSVTSQNNQRMNAGTVKCDGKIRGTAMVVDTREFAPDLKGVVLASAAHVLYDLNKKRRFKRCEFQLLALGELRRYQAKIDLRRLKMGDYDPRMPSNEPEFGEGDWVFMYVPRPWRAYDAAEALVPRAFSFANMESFQQAGGELRLVAFDAVNKTIRVSRHCRVIESGPGDLGGGLWKGQLLDDCDSANGSSGGGIIAVLGGDQYLVGIRNGEHWSAQAYPAGRYPLGPPDGANWDSRANTNFARAFDAVLLSELKDFVHSLGADTALF